MDALLSSELERAAHNLVESNGLSCKRVVSVDRDSILYLNGMGRPRTLWLDVPSHGPLRVDMRSGFVATEPAGWHHLRSRRF